MENIYLKYDYQPGAVVTPDEAFRRLVIYAGDAPDGMMLQLHIGWVLEKHVPDSAKKNQMPLEFEGETAV